MPPLKLGNVFKVVNDFNDNPAILSFCLSNHPSSSIKVYLAWESLSDAKGVHAGGHELGESRDQHANSCRRNLAPESRHMRSVEEYPLLPLLIVSLQKMEHEGTLALPFNPPC